MNIKDEWVCGWVSAVWYENIGISEALNQVHTFYIQVQSGILIRFPPVFRRFFIKSVLVRRTSSDAACLRTKHSSIILWGSQIQWSMRSAERFHFNRFLGPSSIFHGCCSDCSQGFTRHLFPRFFALRTLDPLDSPHRFDDPIGCLQPRFSKSRKISASSAICVTKAN